MKSAHGETLLGVLGILATIGTLAGLLAVRPEAPEYTAPEPVSASAPAAPAAVTAAPQSVIEDESPGAEPVEVAAAIEESALETGETSAEDAALIALVSNGEIVAEGEKQYNIYCLACHGTPQQAIGEAASNLFDAQWFHGGTPTGIKNTILIGYETMPGWQMLLQEEQIDAMVAYILSQSPGEG